MDIVSNDCAECSILLLQFKELQEQDQILISDQDERIMNLEKKIAQHQNKLIQSQEELTILKKESQTTILRLEKAVSQKEQTITELQSKLQQYNRKIVELEIDLEQNECKNRELSQVNADMEGKMDRILEQLALVQTELEMQRNSSQDQIERLRQELRDSQDELYATRKQRMTSFSSVSTVGTEYAKLYQTVPTIDTVRANAAGFNKSLTLISALIKDLDDKMTVFRQQKV